MNKSHPRTQVHFDLQLPDRIDLSNGILILCTYFVQWGKLDRDNWSSSNRTKIFTIWEKYTVIQCSMLKGKQ